VFQRGFSVGTNQGVFSTAGPRTIPVLTVHDYDFSPANFLGAHYILVEYIEGTVACELGARKGLGRGTFGTRERDLWFRLQMVGIQAELASLKFDRIGCFNSDEDSSESSAGPGIETGKGNGHPRLTISMTSLTRR
jgi:hypothetical protein